jgi:hypothetical protein
LRRLHRIDWNQRNGNASETSTQRPAERTIFRKTANKQAPKMQGCEEFGLGDLLRSDQKVC